MRREQTTGALRNLCDRLFDLIAELAGTQPQLVPDGGWYRAESGGRGFVYLRPIGEAARTFPPNSVHLATRWDESLHDEGVTAGNNWYGSEASADLVVRANNTEEVARAETFIRQAYALYG